MQLKDLAYIDLILITAKYVITLKLSHTTINTVHYILLALNTLYYINIEIFLK